VLARRPVTVVAVAALGLLPLACSSGDDSASSDTTVAAGDSSADTTTTGGASGAADTTSSTEAAAPQGTTTATATGAFTFDVSGPGGSCAYYFPTEQRGVTYDVSSTEFPDYTGPGWSLHIQGDSADTAGVLLSTDETSYAENGDGTNLHVDPELHHADFDIDLVNIVNHGETVHLTGTIDCP
jgi:hypothetical protein